MNDSSVDPHTIPITDGILLSGGAKVSFRSRRKNKITLDLYIRMFSTVCDAGQMFLEWALIF